MTNEVIKNKNYKLYKTVSHDLNIILIKTEL